MDRFWKATKKRQSGLIISVCLVILLVSACQHPALLASVIPPTQAPLPSAVPPTLTPLPVDPPSLVLGQPFTLELGQERVLPEADLHLRFDYLLEDSRCPRQVLCVWSGQVRVAIKVWSGAAIPALLEFSTVTRPPVTTNVHFVKGLTIQLMAVEPYPDSPATPIPEEDYRLTLVVK
jgi:hypothetical protein